MMNIWTPVFGGIISIRFAAKGCSASFPSDDRGPGDTCSCKSPASHGAETRSNGVYGLQIFYRILILLMLVWGTVYLTIQPAYSVHLYLIALYLFVTFFELRGNPFNRGVYHLLILLLLANAGMQFFLIEEPNILSGFVSLFFAFFAWQSVQRLRRG